MAETPMTIMTYIFIPISPDVSDYCVYREKRASAEQKRWH